MTIQQVPQGRLRSPFYPRQASFDCLNRWHEWKGYSSADGFYDTALEYFSLRNSCGVFDITPMTKYRITGRDSLAFVDRLVTRDMSKIKPGRVAYAVWCNDEGQVIDDGTIFHLREGEYRLCSQERHMAWLTAAAIGMDVSTDLLQ
jgi:aminomethyltransferase